MKTLILIDVQNDFIPGGSLEVPSGDEIVPVINQIQSEFELVVATQDWHPSNHVSFASNHSGKKPFDQIQLGDFTQTLWPDHCVQGRRGAEFYPTLETRRVETIFRKGTDPKIDSYSGFYDNGHKKSTGLAGYLREKGASELYFCGLAADICVFYSARDALDLGFQVIIIEDAVAALNETDYRAQRETLRPLGVRYVRSNHLL